MKLYLAKPDLMYFDQYNEMMTEWTASNTRIAPWFLDTPIATLEDFAKFIRMLDDAEHGIVDKRFSATSSYFVVDENDHLVGASSFRPYLTVDSFNSWGHIGYGIRPSERLKGYATQTLKLMLQEAKQHHLRKVLLGVYESNIGSWKTVEKCGGILENRSRLPGETEDIRRYWIKIEDIGFKFL